MSSFEHIEKLLLALVQRFRRGLALLLGGWYLAVLLVILGLALVLAELGFAGAGAWLVLLAFLAAVGLWAWQLRFLRAPWRRWAALTRLATGNWPSLAGSTATAGAHLAEALAPEVGSAPSTAVDLARRLHTPEPGFSPDLAALHLERTAERLKDIDFAARLGHQHQRPRRRTALVLAAASLWAILLAVALDAGRARLGALFLHPGAARFSDVPLAGDIQILYRYPAYTGLAQRVVEGGDGSIAAVVGTEVELNAVADVSVESAVLRMTTPEGDALQDIPMQVGGRTLNTRFTVLRDARYHFALVDDEGDAVEERLAHAIRAVPDAYPEINLDAPLTDIEIKDDQTVDILWRAKDDFGVAEVNLVLEAPGKEAKRFRLAGPEEMRDRREGRYRWDVAGAGVEPGAEAVFYVEAIDNDAVSKPKRAVSATRRLSLFSARRHHQDVLATEQEVLDLLVDWLGEELVTPVPRTLNSAALRAQSALVERMGKVEAQLAALLLAMRGDKLTRPEYLVAFGNVMEHVTATRRERSAALALAARADAPDSARVRLQQRQESDVKQLEKDVIYLDDLIALQHIDELKETAKDLLAAQRDLQDLLQQYRNTQDPELRARIEEQIRDLRRRMMEMLARMSQIKQGLPGEYRNLEAATMLQLEDQLDRLEELLRQGDLEGAAAELEQLANLLERMTNSLNEAEEEYGGERYAEMRKQLAEFAQQFRALEAEQKALAQRAESLLSDYRKRAVEQTGRNLEDFVKKARDKVGEAIENTEGAAAYPRASRDAGAELESARQRLADLDALLKTRDFAQAQEVGAHAEQAEAAARDLLAEQARWTGGAEDHELRKARSAAERALKRTQEVNDMLDQLFPEPSEVMSPEQMQQLRRMAKKQQELRQQATELGQRMGALAQELPLFGGEPRESLEEAKREMQSAQEGAQQGNLPGAAQHKRRASDELAKLRDALEKASQGGQGGLPMPLGMGGGGRGKDDGGAGEPSREKVDFPADDPRRADPRFRKELLEAAKQKAPEGYEKSVRRYYEELIR